MRLLYVSPGGELGAYIASDCEEGLETMRERIPCEDLASWAMTKTIQMWHDGRAVERSLAVNGPALKIVDKLKLEPREFFRGGVVRGAVFFTGQATKEQAFTDLAEESFRYIRDLLLNA